MRLRDIGRYVRARRAVENPRALVRAHGRGSTGHPIFVRLKGWGPVFIRPGTADVRILKEIFIKDVYGLSHLEQSAGQGEIALDSVVDVGGHIGLFAIRAAAIARRVLTFEPISTNADLLARNLHSASSGNVELQRLALSADGAPLELFVSNNTGGHSAVPSLADPGAISKQVSAITLEQVFEKFSIEKCDLLKLDCEGGEYPVLFGSTSQTLSRIQRIALEYHSAESSNPDYTGRSLDGFLTAHGFETRRIPSKKRENHGLIHARRAQA